MKKLIFLTLILAIILMFGCGVDVNTVTLIDVSPSPVTISKTATQEFTATGTNTLGDAIPFTPSWTSTDTDIVSLEGHNPTDQTAKFRALNLGTAEVRAYSGTVYGTAVVTVETGVPTTESFYADYCTYVDSLNSGTNYGATAEARVGYTGTATYRAFAKFSVSSISSSATISSATLKIYVHDLSTTEAMTVQIRLPLSDWQESNITWGNQPSAPDLVVESSVSTGGVYKEFDITTAVSDWVDKTKSNYGLRIAKIALGEGQSGYFYFQGKDTTNKPQLVVDYVP